MMFVKKKENNNNKKNIYNQKLQMRQISSLMNELLKCNISDMSAIQWNPLSLKPEIKKKETMILNKN